MLDSLLDLIAATADRPALGSAVAALIGRLGSHPAQRVGDSALYTELSISYLSVVAEVSIGTAHTAWHIVRGVVGWRSISVAEVRALGLAPRERARGQRWGQHLLLSPETREACRLARPIGPTSEEQVEWLPIERVGRKAARCPWHDDRRPSAIWNLDPSGTTACVVCMVCRDAADRPLVALAEQTDRGEWRARLSARTLSGSISDPAFSGPDVETLQGCIRPSRAVGVSREDGPDLSARTPTRTVAMLPPPTRRGEILLGSLASRGMARRPSSREDLLAILRSAEQRAGDRDWGSAVVATESADPKRAHPDRLVSVQSMRPVEWTETTIRGRSIARPTRWEPVEQRWVLVDLDGLAAPLLRRGDVDRFVERAREITSTDSWLDGALAVVRTSTSGVQVWMRLARSVDPSRFGASRIARSWLRGIGAALADEIEGLGLGRPLVDPSAFRSHRYGRRPGWRIKNGEAERATLLVASEAA